MSYVSYECVHCTLLQNLVFTDFFGTHINTNLYHMATMRERKNFSTSILNLNNKY